MSDSDIWIESIPSIELVLILKNASSEPDILNREKFLNGIETLDLSKQNLAEIPEFIRDCKKLKQLNMSDNFIAGEVNGTMLPPALERLDLSNNRITEFSLEGFSDVGLNTLRVLKLSNNKIASVPSNLDSVSKLSVLWLDNNEIESLTKDTRYPNSSISLHLNNNKITEVQVGRAGLTRCADINLSGNKIKSIPTQLIKGRLKFLNVSGNDIEDWDFLDTAIAKNVSVKR